MPTKHKPNDGNVSEAIQAGMWEIATVSSFIFSFYSKTVTEILVFLLTDEILSRTTEYLQLLKCFVSRNILAHSFLILHGLYTDSKTDGKLFFKVFGSVNTFEVKNQCRTLNQLVDHVHQEKEENIDTLFNNCPQNLQRICYINHGHISCYLVDFELLSVFVLKKKDDSPESQFYVKLFWKEEFKVFSLLVYCILTLMKGRLKVQKGSLNTNVVLPDKNLGSRGLEEMLEKKISCNGSTAATTLINLNANVNKNNASGSGSASNSNNKNCSSGGANASETSASKPIDDMAVETEDIATRNTCKTEKDSINVKVEPANGPAVTSACDTKPVSTLVQPNSVATSLSVTNVNGANSGEQSLNTSPKLSPQSRENKNDSCTPSQTPFCENINENAGKISDDKLATSKGSGNLICAGAIKTEVTPNPGVNATSLCGGPVPPCSQLVGTPNLPGPPSAVQSNVSIQPLPSNMVNKSSTSIESQYMQQQSQIFVFSTTLANKAAEAVLSEHYPSIIAFHCAQPGTVRFLEKHPLKVQQFHRQSSAMWLNNLAQMKQGNRQIKAGPINPMQSSLVNHQFTSGPCGQCHGPCNHSGPVPRIGGARGPPMNPDGCHGPPDFGFPHRNNWSHIMNGPNNSPVRCDPRFQNPVGNRPMFPHGVNSHGNDHPMGNNFGYSSLDSNKLNSVKVPDENLTPEQRQHRKEQLVILRNLGQLLLPDLHSSGDVSNSQSPMGMNSQMLVNQQGHPHCPGDVRNHMGVQPPNHPRCGNDLNEPAHPASPAGTNNFSNQKGPMLGEQGEWQRLNQLYEERNMKCMNMAGGGSSLSQSPEALNQNQPPHLSHLPITPQSGVKQQQPSLTSSSPTIGSSPTSTIRVQGPPPPYHQGSRCPVPSPHPASPSGVPLSSPHMASGLPSPAEPSRSFSHTPGGVNRLSHQSPGGGSLHSTPLSSPKPSNPSTNTLPKTSTTPIPISTSNMQSNPNNPVPSPGSIISTTTTGPKRKPSTTPGSVPQHLVDAEFESLSHPLTPNSDPAIFGSNRSLHLSGQSPRATPKPMDVGQPCTVKEPSLMPVPSPQQIQYLNAFEGQELTIQKQPNTSLRETDILAQTTPIAGAETVNQNSPPFSGPDVPRNTLSNMPGPGCNSVLCSCSNEPHPRFQPMNNTEMYPCHPNQGLDGPMQRFRGPGPNNMNFQNQMPGLMPRFGMEMHRFRGHHVQNEMGPARYSFNGPMRPDGMMIRNQFPQGNMNSDPLLARQYSSPVPSNNQMFDGHPQHPHNLPTLQKITSPLNHQFGMDEGGPNMGLGNGSQRLSHFDPIASMTAMSDSALASPGLHNRNQNPNPMMNIGNMNVTNNPSGCNPGVNLNPNMPSMQAVNQSSNNHGMIHGQQGVPFMGQHMAHNISPAPQAVSGNNTFVNATMSIQQLNLQNVTTSNFNPAQSISPTSGIMKLHQIQGAGGNTVSSQASTNHPIMHSGGVPSKPMSGSLSANSLQQFPSSPLGVSKRGSSPLPQNSPGMMPRNPGAIGSPGYLSPNVHVKASAPNTIQYLPARPQNCSSVSNRPPSLDFLQRYASPLTNLDSKVPTHNLQYFPNAGPNNGSNGMPMPSPGGDNGLVSVNHDLDSQMRLSGQMNRNNMGFMGGPQIPNAGSQHLPTGPSMLNEADFNRTAGGPAGNTGPNMNSSMNNMGPVNSPLGIFHSNKHLPLSPSGLAPDTSQPLPSSMGQTLNYKQSPFYGPTTADPNYAVQFHNFQQQLYATNTRGNQQGNSQNISGNPSFFNLK